jgi:ferredoxin-NADP reductase
MQSPGAHIEVVVRRVTDETRSIKTFELVPVRDEPLPSYAAGAHIDVSLGERLVRSYSLIGPLGDPGVYRIAVGLDPKSRGGSSHLHQTVVPGARLTISAPRNHFALAEQAPSSLLIAGGIGITPLWCMVQRLNQIGSPWQLHYASRSREAAAFVEPLTEAARTGCGEVNFWFDDERGGQPMDVARIVTAARADAHLYCCGPAPMMDVFRKAATSESSDRIHLEYFRPAESVEPRGAFEVELARSGRVVPVKAGSSILDALIMQGIDAPYSCYEGLCGTCETRVLDGVPDHRDSLLTESAKASNKTIIICCSGSRSPRLVLDL